MSHDHNCWHCGAADAGSMFCRYCNHLQAPTPDYYEFFGLPRNLALDPDELQKRFYSMSRKFHPDVFTLHSDQEKRYSLEASSILNDAYRILRDPILRAEYVLKEAGFDIGEQRGKDVPPELLEEVFELNMALDELRSGDEDALPQLDGMRQHFIELLQQIDKDVEKQFRRHDAETGLEQRRAILSEIRSMLNRRRYIRNLVNEVDKQLTARNA